MKRIIFILVVLLTAVLSMCSFAIAKPDNENKYLQKHDSGAALCKNIHPMKATEHDSEGDIKSNLDEKMKDIFSEFENLVPEGIPTDTESLAGAVGIGEVIEYLLSAVKDEGKSLKTLCAFLGIALLLCLAELLSEEAADAAPAVRSSAMLILSIPVLGAVKEVIAEVGEGIGAGSEFFGGVIPILTSVAAIGSSGLTAAGAAATMSFSLSFVSGILAKNLFPVATLIFISSLLAGIDTGQGIAHVAKGLRGWFNFIIGITSLVIVATLGTQTLIASARDTLTLRSAKYAISGMIPVVGGTVSGALSMLVSGVRLLSSSIGVVSVTVLLSFMAVPLIKLLFYRLCIWACITLTSFSGASNSERFFSALRGAVDCLIATLASSLLVFILEIIIFTANLNGIA